MANLKLQLFGPGALTLDGAPLRPHSAKTFALLAFLVLEAPRSHGREKLAAMLWGDQPERSARQSLRQALHSLRSLGGAVLGDCIFVDRERVAFVPARTFDVDAMHFLDLVRAADKGRWIDAADLYHAPVLDGRSFDAGDEFDLWLGATRERFHALALHNLDRLAADHIARSDWDAAHDCARRLRDLDPDGEAAGRHLSTIAAARGADLARLADGTETLASTRGDAVSVAHAQGAPEPFARAPGDPATFARTAGNPAPLTRAAPDAEPFVHAAQAAERVHAFSQAADLYDRALRILERDVPTRPPRLCEVLLLKEAALERLGRRAEQVETIERALGIADALGDASRTASVLLRKAGACAYVGDTAEAVRAAQRALAIHRDIGDAPGEAEALRELGFVHWRAGDFATALHCARDALALHRKLGDVTGEASALHNLAEIHRELGSPRRAIDWYGQALPLHWAARNPAGEILTLFGLANALWQDGDRTTALRKYEDALALAERHGERTMQSRALRALATRHAANGDLDAALGLMRRAIELGRAIGYAHGLGHDLLELARLHVARGERAEAVAALTEATVWFGFTEDRDALDATRARIAAIESGADSEPDPAPAWQGVRSHLTLGEGKVYCAFDSPGAPGSCSPPPQAAP